LCGDCHAELTTGKVPPMSRVMSHKLEAARKEHFRNVKNTNGGWED
jgi:hypothetical protein